MTYEYLGEDSSDVLMVAFAFQDAQRAVGLTAKGWSKSAKVLGEPGTWTGEAADAAKSDASKIGGILAETDKTLNASQKALVSYANTLATLWGQVYDLNTELVKQQNIISAANDTLQSAHGEEDRGTGKAQQKAFAIADQAHTDISRANKAIGDLDDQYAGLKRKQSEAAHTCITALTTPAGKKGVTFGGKQSLTQLNSILGLDKLDVGPLLQAEKDSKSLLNRKQPIDYNDPQVQAEIKDLNAILKAHSGDAKFTTPYLQNLGQHNLVQLSGELSLMYTGEDKDAPPIMSTVANLEKQLGNSLATSTHNLGGTDQLNQTWIDGLKKQGESKFDFQLSDEDGDKTTVYGYLPLTALMGDADISFSAPVLQQVGEDMRHMEQGYKDAPAGSDIWIPDSAIPNRHVVFNWDQAAGKPFNTGVDPFANWTAAMDHSPASARAVMANDNDLTNYLLNDRKWTLYTGDDPRHGSVAVLLDGDPNTGLKAFGSMLGDVDDPKDPNATKMMENVVNDLGDGHRNHRLQNDFAGTNWIPPEIRGGVADLVSHHLSKINLTMQHSLNELPQGDAQRVLADLGKDEEAYKTLYKGEAAFAGVTITNALRHGEDAGSLATGYGDINKFLDHGADTGWAHEKTEAAEEHNKYIEWGGDIFKVAAKTAADAGMAASDTELAAPAADEAIDKLTDGILGQFKENPGPEIQSHDQFTFDKTSQDISNNVAQAAYAAMTPQQQHQMFGANPPAAGALTDAQIDQLESKIGTNPELTASSAAITAGSQSYNDVNMDSLGKQSG